MLAYKRLIFAQSCSRYDIYYEFNADGTWRELDHGDCNTGNFDSVLSTGQWTVKAATLTQKSDDVVGQQQDLDLVLHPAAGGKAAQLILTWTSAGRTYTQTLDKV